MDSDTRSVPLQGPGADSRARHCGRGSLGFAVPFSWKGRWGLYLGGPRLFPGHALGVEANGPLRPWSCRWGFQVPGGVGDGSAEACGRIGDGGAWGRAWASSATGRGLRSRCRRVASRNRAGSARVPGGTGGSVRTGTGRSSRAARGNPYFVPPSGAVRPDGGIGRRKCPSPTTPGRFRPPRIHPVRPPSASPIGLPMPESLEKPGWIRPPLKSCYFAVRIFSFRNENPHRKFSSWSKKGLTRRYRFIIWRFRATLCACLDRRYRP